MTYLGPIPSGQISTASTSSPTTTSASYVTIPEMSISISSGRDLFCQFAGAFNVQTNDDFSIAIFVDDVEITVSEVRVAFFGGSLLGLTPAQILSMPTTCMAKVSVSPGDHVVTARWKRTAGTARAILLQRHLFVTEVG